MYEYDHIPHVLRVQVIHIMREAIGHNDNEYNLTTVIENVYSYINKGISKEYGMFTLGEDYENHETAITNFLLKEQNHEKIIDIIEVIVRLIDRYIRDNNEYKAIAKTILSADDAIKEINMRFKDNKIGYEYISGQMIRIDHQVVHDQAIKPVLYILKEDAYTGANQEYLKAFGYYRTGDHSDALVNALKAFESTMKVICTKRGWQYGSGDTSSRLISLIIDNELLPKWQNEQLTGLRTMLQTTATPRNRMGAHGQGAKTDTIPEYYVRYALNMTASAILLLVEAEKSSKFI